MKKTPTQRKQCLAIAQDVLAQLRLKLLYPQKGVYCEFSDYVNGDLQEALKREQTKATPCHVCGIGAMFIGAVRLYDKVSFEYETEAPDEDTLRETLGEYFSLNEVRQIEAAFEGWEEYWDFKMEVPEAEKRLIAICRNIIRNRGDLKGQPLASETELPALPRRKALAK